jgi:hypothetical protein
MGGQLESYLNPVQSYFNRMASPPASESMATQLLSATMSQERLAREAMATAERVSQSRLAAAERMHTLSMQSADGNKSAERELSAQRFQLSLASHNQQGAREHQSFLLAFQGESARQVAAAAAATAATREETQRSVAAAREYQQASIEGYGAEEGGGV